MFTSKGFRLVPPALLLAALAGVAFISPARIVAAAAGQAVVQSQDSNFAGVVAELTECKRKDGVLSVKVRLRNTSPATVKVALITNRNFDEFYVTAGSKKYFVLRDTEKTPLASAADPFGSLTVDIQRGGAYTWWAKYPAPPDGETKITLVTPLAAPFEDVPIAQ
jgi:hypothetical protein